MNVPKPVSFISLRVGRDTLTRRISGKQRTEHIYLVGKTRSGKTSLITNMLREDSHSNTAIIWLEPSGVETKKVLGVIDPSRFPDSKGRESSKRRLRYCSLESPLSLNLLSMPYRRQVIYETLIEVINQFIAHATGQMKVSTAMRDILKKFLEAELRKPYPSLQNILNAILDLDVKGWRSEDVDSAFRLAHRLSDILSDKQFNKIICGDNHFDFESFLENRELLVMNCRDMTRDQMLLVGNILVQSVTTYFMHTAKEEFPECAIYIDEFDLFSSKRFIDILRYSGKYRVSALLSHQDHAAATTPVGREILHVIASNAGTILSFRVGAEEAGHLAKIFTTFPARDFQNLEKYHLCARIGIEEFKLRALRPPIPQEVVFIKKPKPFQIKWGRYENKGSAKTAQHAQASQ